jgi:acyl CoA:acetate/3-ketoacid CoA transferase beta subunit
MGVPASEVGYTLATTRRGDHKVHKGHVVALAKKKKAIDVVYTNSVVFNVTNKQDLRLKLQVSNQSHTSQVFINLFTATYFRYVNPH